MISGRNDAEEVWIEGPRSIQPLRIYPVTIATIMHVHLNRPHGLTMTLYNESQLPD
jgi:hypothetical protein